MNSKFKNTLDWIEKQHEQMVSNLFHWANINSSTDNMLGLSQMFEALIPLCKRLKASIETIELPNRQILNNKGLVLEEPLGKALRMRKNTQQPLRLFFGGHMDTVYSASSSFQTAKWLDQKKILGPGVTDMKGGLLVMLYSLLAFEQSPFAEKIDWEVLINPDEEIGSPGSGFLFAEAAKRNHVGLVFEPAFSDGALASSRKSSANFTIIARGREAHVGRDFDQGRNAITALAKLVLKIEALTDLDKGIVVNIGNIMGGGPVNVVPNTAIAKINIRTIETSDFNELEKKVAKILKEDHTEGIGFQLHNQSKTPPKPFDETQRNLFNCLLASAELLGIPLKWRATGGCCDGSRLYAEGLPNIDTLGVVGGNIHTHEEYIELDSLKERTQLTTLFLMQLASGEIQIKTKELSQ
jgi:glutamate carboxypeptidase